MTFEFKNAKIIDANTESYGSVYVVDGKITFSPLCADTVIDCGGMTLMPALIDTHCHLRDPGYPQKETMETGMRTAYCGGYATLVAMANTLPVCETVEQVQENHRKATELNLCRLIQAASAGIGLNDEIKTDRAALCTVTNVISNDGKTIFSDDFMQELLEDSAKHGFIVSTHCQPERATVRRDIELLKKVGGRLHVGHISTAETVSLIKNAKADLAKTGFKAQNGSLAQITCEVMPHHLFGWDNDYRVNPPLRTREDAYALREALCTGVIDCLATDHAPHTPEDKQAGMAGISIFDHAFSIFMQVFYEMGYPLTLFSRLAAYNPSLLLGLSPALIAEGAVADLILVDTKTVYSIDSTTMLSRSHNTPFDGKKVRGRVKLTMIGGKILYDHDGQAGC